ncbi:MAG: site-specific integrase, partial [Treponema sp.]|nr:site-specific integrase [Treponema sp.]
MPNRTAVEEYLSYLRAVRGVSELTVEAYGNDLSRFANYCENHEIDAEKAGSADLRGFIADLHAEKIKPVSVNRALSSLRGFYRWMLRFGRRADNPCDDLRNLKTPVTLPAVLWEREMASFAELPGTAGILWPAR